MQKITKYNQFGESGFEFLGKTKKRTKKKLFEGTFNWHGEVLIIYSHASSEKQAFSMMITRLSNKLDFTRVMISNYFLDSWKDNYKIKEVRK